MTKWRRLGVGGAGRNGFRRTAFGHHRFPVLDELGRAFVNLHPDECISKDVAMGEGALRARAGCNIAQPSLQTENLAQPLDVAPCQRQLAEPRTSSASPLRDGLKAVPYNRRLSGLP